ncbi:SDR family NAD(P)-dependent oxidoreductase, partial [Schumannella luteola]
MNTRIRPSQNTHAQLEITSGSTAHPFRGRVSKLSPAPPGCGSGVGRSVGWGIVNDVLPSDSLRGVRALITGSSRGIGADTAGYLADAGARVVINYRNKEARALKVVAGIEERGGEAIAIGADLTDPASVAAMLAEVRERWGGLDLLVLNASGGMESGLGEDYAMRLNR